jgi:WD40 repeat protein
LSTFSEKDKGAPPVVRSNHESIDLTEEMDVCIDDSQPSIVANQVASKQDSERNNEDLKTATSLDDVADDEESDSPDEIPAKPVRRLPSTVTRDEVPRSTVPAVSHVPPEAFPTPKNDSGSEVKLQIDRESRNDTLVMLKTIAFPGKGKGNHGVPYSAEEDSLLAHLREDLGVGWDAMPQYFCGRTRGSLQVRYSSKVKNRNSVPAKPQAPSLHKPTFGEATVRTEYTAPSRRHPKVPHRDDGFVSWAELKAQRQEDRAAVESATPPTRENASAQTPDLGLELPPPVSLPRILRSRELGNTGRRNWSSTARMKVSDELQNHVLDTLGPRKYFHGASRDVTCVAWAADGNHFAAGAIAIDDERSMQYNRPNNLLLGNLAQNSLHELPEHHVARPIVSDSRNVNSLHAMQETQDTRLFKTVAAVGFSEDSRALYSAGADGFMRMYDASSRQCISSLKQDAELALLTSNSRGLLATGSHRSDDSSISVIRSHSDRLECLHRFGPTRADVQSSLPIFPSALKWGAGIHSHLLLAGFASDSYEDDRLAAGEVFLWDSTADQKIELPAARNVFDVAWNPIPSAKASLFAVACARSGKQFRSSIECFAPNQGRASRVLQWDCPAFDINDLVYCPHDDNLIAAGATDGKVYIWDKRVVGRDAKPLHTLAHGATKNILDHDRDVEMADTGVRFLSWSATGNRLYSGSSDGTVKVWNPYRTTEDALVKDVATFNSAVMSGAFSPDFRDLLIGEDAGQLNLLGIDREARSVRAAKKFDYYPAPVPASTMDEGKLGSTRELLASGQLEVRPMGALPVKQTVQGPNYRGPFLAPSDDHLEDLNANLQLALREQQSAHASLSNSMQNPDTEKTIQAVDEQVRTSEKALQKAWQSREDYQVLQRAASLLQENLHNSRCAYEKEVGHILSESCCLDCNYLPTAGDYDGEAPDNRPSEQRIPHSLRTQGKVLDTSDMTNAEIAEAGLTSTCSGTACMNPAAKPRSKRDLPVCEKCTLVRSELTARCERCAAPVHPNLDERVRQNICERCNFHCFRCGSVAVVSPTGDNITCEACDMQWEAGVLGYEVKKKSRNSPIKTRDQSHDQVMESLDERMGRLLGEDERERLAGDWRVALVDGY